MKITDEYMAKLFGWKFKKIPQSQVKVWVRGKQWGSVLLLCDACYTTDLNAITSELESRRIPMKLSIHSDKINPPGAMVGQFAIVTHCAKTPALALCHAYLHHLKMQKRTRKGKVKK